MIDWAELLIWESVAISSYLIGIACGYSWGRSTVEPRVIEIPTMKVFVTEKKVDLEA